MVRINAKAYTNAARARLAKARKQIDRAAKATVSQLVSVGKEKAREIVPKYSGETYRSIKTQEAIGKDGPIGKIIIDPYILNDGHKRNIANFSLVRWMHESPKAEGHIKSGERQFMYLTRGYLNSIKKGVATGRFKNINIR